jgi:uncharacterized spore protein YtfJ
MEPVEVFKSSQENINASRVFGEPFHVDGAVILPVAVVGGGGGVGSRADHQGGMGLGFGARPAGIYVIKNGEATWRPALNVNLIIAGGQLVALAGLLALRSWFTYRRAKSV